MFIPHHLRVFFKKISPDDFTPPVTFELSSSPKVSKIGYFWTFKLIIYQKHYSQEQRISKSSSSSLEPDDNPGPSITTKKSDSPVVTPPTYSSDLESLEPSPKEFSSFKVSLTHSHPFTRICVDMYVPNL